MTDLLVIGYGNDMRNDDGAGRAVADAVVRRGLPGITVRSVTQLTPELAGEIAGCGHVVFVDAMVGATELRVEPVEAGDPPRGVITHHGDPAALLALVARIGATPPERATAISIPAVDVQLGFDLTPATAAAVNEAVELIVAMAND